MTSVLHTSASLLLVASTLCVAGERIDPELSTLAATQDRLHVLIVLSRKPARDIVRQAEAEHQEERDGALKRLNQAIRGPFPLGYPMKAARAELDQVILKIRREALARIRTDIQAQQNDLIVLLQSWGARNIRAHTIANTVTAELPSSILPTLNADPDIVAVFPTNHLHPLLNVSVPAMLAPAFWSAHTSGAGESVGVLDSGVMTSNPGLSSSNIVSHVSLDEGSQDPCFADDTTPNDNLGHGTHIAGIIASQGGGSCPTCIGAAPGVTLYNLKIGWLASGTISGCTSGGEADAGDILDAIEWALTNTAVTVFNFSWAAPAVGADDGFSQTFDEIGDAWGVSIVMAAGNLGPSVGVETPGISYNGVTVASLDDQGTIDRSDDSVSDFSSRGPSADGRYKPDISAPGNHSNAIGGILSTYINGDYAGLAGTSMATAHVTGAMALIRSAGGLDGLSAKAVLLNSAYNTKSGWQPDAGWGFVDLSQASTQVDRYFRGSVAAETPAFYSGTAIGPLKTTLVWNRHLTGSGPLTPSLSNLGLYAYDAGSGIRIGNSTSTVQNVEQVVTAANGPIVLEVMPVTIGGGDTSESYALAVSAAGFAAKSGPALSMSCAGPSAPLTAGATFTVSCTVSNSGDLAAFAVNGILTWSGVSFGPVNQFGEIGAGEQLGPQSWQVTLPAPGSQQTLTGTINDSYGQTATTTLSWYTLTTGVLPSASGIVSPSVGASGEAYPAGTQVCLTATPNAGWVFGNWSGATLDGNNCLTLNANTTVTANFVPAYTLAIVVSPTGAGSVTANPPGGSYVGGTKVCLTETPNSGWLFSSWSGATLDGNNCLTLNANTTVTANFVPTYTLALAVSPTGAGSVTANPPGGVYVSGTKVCLTATPNYGWVFTSWSGATLDSNNCLTLQANTAVAANFVGSGSLLFVPVTPCRIADTRNAKGPFGGPAITGGTSRDFTIPSGSCGIPSNAAAYSLNAAMIPRAHGWITIWPTGQSQPGTASVNSPDGRVKSSGAIVPAGTSGAISVYASATTVSTNVALDINGYFVPASSNPTALQFYPLTPCRVADTRRTPAGPLNGPYMTAGSTRMFSVFSATSCNVPTSAQAFSLNLTVVPRGSTMRWLTAWPSDQTQPVVSSLNDPPGVTLSNAGIIAAPGDNSGDVSIYVTDDTDVVIDVNGYFAPPGSDGLSLHTMAPCRVLDTRNPTGSPPFTGTLAVDVKDSGCGAPATAQDYVFNATLVPESSHGYLTLWSQGQTISLAANVTVSDGMNTGNMALVPTNNGLIDAYSNNSTYLVLDLFGYFAP